MNEKDPGKLHLENFDEVIKIFEKKGKSKPKYKTATKLFKEAQERLENIIEKLKEVKIKPQKEGEEEKSFYDAYISGNEKFVSFKNLGELLFTHRNEIKEESMAIVEGINLSTKAINTRFGFIDALKNVVNQITDEKDLSKKIQKGCLFAFAGELLTHGVTSILAKKGIIDGSMGLIGLGKLGISKAPLLLPYLEKGAMMIAGMPQLALALGGAFLVVKGIPMIKRTINKVKEKYNNARAVDKRYEEILREQKEADMAFAGA